MYTKFSIERRKGLSYFYQLKKIKQLKLLEKKQASASDSESEYYCLFLTTFENNNTIYASIIFIFPATKLV